jgi:TQXA domain-containing protein/LPXTG-motif cell wall-anchored protein
MVLRHHAARCGVLAATAVAALLVTTLPAVAATTGVFAGGTRAGATVTIDGQRTQTTLLGLELEDHTLLETYCVELDVNARRHARLAEAPWADYPDAGEQFNAHPEKVLWILHNSYPNVTLGDLSAKAGAQLDEAEAIAGTQAAIWHFSNGADLDATGNPADIAALYGYLTGSANTGVAQQPPVSLSITPAGGAEAQAGAAAGPFTVHTTAAHVTLKVDGPDGVHAVGPGGAPLTTIADGTQFWLSAPAGAATGEATVSAFAKAEVQKGRLFVGIDNDTHPTQTLIVAANTKAAVTAESSARWTPAAPSTSTTTTTTRPPVTTSTTPSNAFTVPATPSQGGPLANTGASVLPALGLAVLLLAAGIGALLLQRRRRTD